MPRNEKPSVFLSHSSADKPVVRKFAERIEALGYHVWLDESEIKPGDSLVEKIQEGIRKSDYFLVFFTQESRNKFWVKRELDMAVSEASGRNVPLIPIALEKDAVPGFFKGILYIDCFTQPFESAWRELKEFFIEESKGLVFTRSSGRPPRTKQPPPGTIGLIVNQGKDCVIKCAQRLMTENKRFHRKVIATCLDRNEVGVLWYDLFENKMDDEFPGMPLPNCIVELLDRSVRKGLGDELLQVLCEDHCRAINNNFS